jgi:hypothetical protein
MSDETNLEEAFRAGLQRHAEDVDTTVDLLGPAHAAARGRRRRSWVAGSVGLAAAALVTAIVVQQTGESDGPNGTTVLDQGALPAQWRTEAWHGLQVEVPADWAWGSAPVESTGESLRCGGPDADEPYVGRPVMASDVCMMAKHFEPTAPYVWLGADVAPGTEDVGHGLVQTTVEVEGTTLTVAARGQALIDHVIASAGPVEGCATSIGGEVAVDSMLTEGLRNPRSAQVCAYEPVRNSLNYELVYATTLDRAQASTYHSQVYDGGFESSPEFCDDAAGTGERVLITVTGEDPYGGPGSEVTQATVVDPACREVSGSPGMVSPLSDRGMAAWAVGGLPVTLYGLIGPQG